jgi:hypothetical protein
MANILNVTVGFLLWARIRRNAALDHFGHDPDFTLLFAAETGSSISSASRAAWTVKAAYVAGWPLFMIVSAIWQFLDPVD